jgi:hypothetical protein
MSRCIRVSTLVLSLILAEGQSAAAAELPTYEVMGFPITSHQVSLMGFPNVQERSPSLMLMSDGMPASFHQVTVLAPRPRMIEGAAALWTRVEFPAPWVSEPDGHILNGRGDSQWARSLCYPLLPSCWDQSMGRGLKPHQKSERD